MIRFFKEDVVLNTRPLFQSTKWINNIIIKNAAKCGDINYILCSDEYLHKINLDFLKHDDYTDIITFDNSEEEGVIAGDIYISLERVNDNAHINKTDPDEELHRVMIHGVLHLLGLKDKSEEEKKIMRQKEDEALSLRKNRVFHVKH
jgi:probable rRNA maturation factor